MFTVWDIIYLRRPLLNYVSPPVCEVVFSGSSNPIIILSEPVLGQVQGVTIGGFGGFQLTWNVFPGALCYNVYFIGGDNIAVILAQCITNPNFVVPGPGVYVITAITEEGEGPPSEPITIPSGGGGGVSRVSMIADCSQTSRESFPGSFMIFREPGDTIGSLTVFFTFSGTALNGVDFNPVPLSATIPNGSDFVNVLITIAGPVTAMKTVTMTLNQSPTYFVNPDNTDYVKLKPSIYRLTDYGGLQPLLVPAADSNDVDFCEWDGTWNLSENPDFVPPDENVRYYSFTDRNDIKNFPDVSIQGKEMLAATISGPFATQAPQPPGVYWAVSIVAYSDIPGPGDILERLVWAGQKNSGATGAGVYGSPNPDNSDPRPTLTIELA